MRCNCTSAATRSKVLSSRTVRRHDAARQVFSWQRTCNRALAPGVECVPCSDRSGVPPAGQSAASGWRERERHFPAICAIQTRQRGDSQASFQAAPLERSAPLLLLLLARGFSWLSEVSVPRVQPCNLTGSPRAVKKQSEMQGLTTSPPLGRVSAFITTSTPPPRQLGLQLRAPSKAAEPPDWTCIFIQQ